MGPKQVKIPSQRAAGPELVLVSLNGWIMKWNHMETQITMSKRERETAS